MDVFQSMRAFVSTVQSGSMSNAATLLNITPAMVGQRIAALESRLKTKLLNRTTRRQNLTDFGETYFEQCLDILERVSIAEMEAEAQSTEARGTLRITAPVTFGTSMLIPALKRYKEQAPNVSIDVILSDNNLDLIEERLDIAFRIGYIPDSRIIQRKLMPYRMVVCASPDYLEKKGMPTNPEELLLHDILRFSASSAATFTFYGDNGECIVSPQAAMTINNGQGLLNAALAGLGIIIQPEILVSRYLNSGTLCELLKDWKLGERQVSMLYYRDQKMTPRVRSFIDFSLNTFSNLGNINESDD